MTLRPETRDSLTAAAKTLADDFRCGLAYAKKALWVAVCRYVQPPGMTGDVLHSSINPVDVDMVYLELADAWRSNPPPLEALPPPVTVPDAQSLSAPTRCRSDKCRAQIRWGKLNNKAHPFDLDGITSHYKTCKDADRFRRKGAAA